MAARVITVRALDIAEAADMPEPEGCRQSKIWPRRPSRNCARQR
jgi:hypothetical protein